MRRGWPFAPLTTLAGLHRLDALAQRYGTTPAAILGASDAYDAYCVNEATALAAAWQPKATEAPDEPPANATLKMGAGDFRLSGSIPILKQSKG